MNVENKQNKKSKIINNKTPKINNKTTNSSQDNIDKTKKNNPKINLMEEQFIKNEVYIVNNEGQIGCNII
jgi:hypothetical protein